MPTLLRLVLSAYYDIAAAIGGDQQYHEALAKLDERINKIPESDLDHDKLLSSIHVINNLKEEIKGRFDQDAVEEGLQALGYLHDLHHLLNGDDC